MHVLLVQSSSEHGPQLTAALRNGDDESRDKAMDQLAVIIEHVLYELTDIMVHQQRMSTSPQTDNSASTPLLSFLQAGCPSCRPT